jgi:pimeloyl-ACP methyl ester carboxylesterase
MPDLEVNGTVLSYVEQGAGEPLVLVHGSISDYRSWTTQVSFFAEHYRVIAYSRRYHWPHPWTGNGPEYAAELHAADLSALIAGLGLKPAHLVGSSYGAMTSLTCAVRNPAAVRSLVLAEPPILPWLNRSQEGRALFEGFKRDAWEPAARAFEQGDLSGGVKTFVNAISGRDLFGIQPEGSRQTQLDNGPALQAETRARPENYYTPVDCAEVGRLSIPVLLLDGETSPAMFRMVQDELARCLPGAERQVIPQAGHAMARLNPEAFNETVLRFLERVSVRASG